MAKLFDEKGIIELNSVSGFTLTDIYIYLLFTTKNNSQTTLGIPYG